MGEEEVEELIPGLPEEIALECLLRVPPLHSYKVGMVRKLWKSAAETPYFRHRRRQSLASRSNIVSIDDGDGREGKFMILFQEEEDVAAPNGAAAGTCSCRLILYDIEKRDWRCASLAGNFPAAKLPDCCVISMTGEKLVVMGDLTVVGLLTEDEESWAASRSISNNHTCVWVYDFSKGVWREGAPMPGPRRFFFAHASDGIRTVFVAGGWSPGSKEALCSAMAYDVERDEWSNLPPMARKRSLCVGVVLDDKFYVASHLCCREVLDLMGFSWSEGEEDPDHDFWHETYPGLPGDFNWTDFNYFSSAELLWLLTKPITPGEKRHGLGEPKGGDVRLHAMLDLENSHLKVEHIGLFMIQSEDEKMHHQADLPSKYAATAVRGVSLTNFLIQKLYQNFIHAPPPCTS